MGGAYGFKGRGAEHGGAAGDLQAYDFAGLVNGGGEDDGAFLVGGAGYGWVGGVDGGEEHAGGNAGGEADLLG